MISYAFNIMWIAPHKRFVLFSLFSIEGFLIKLYEGGIMLVDRWEMNFTWRKQKGFLRHTCTNRSLKIKAMRFIAEKTLQF
ncbi:hypothetical protein DN395_00625 [Bacillus sp. AR18-7]|nr:hypothetical protein DN395_00625 [Bacillus sp. AR18-7]